MKRANFLLITLVALLSACQPGAAQKFQPKTIQFKGAPEYSDQELLDAAGLKKGTVLNFAEMKGHSQKMMDTGIFETLSFKFDGVDLIYTLIPSTTLYPLHIENLPLTPGKELDAALHDRFPLYHGKVPGDGGLMEQVRQALEEMLAAHGIKATVMAAAFADPKVHKVTAITYSIASPPVRVGKIHLDGVSSALQAKVESVASHETGSSFDTENAARNLEHAFELFYGDEGYAAVKVHALRSGDPVATDTAIDIPFSVTVEEGRFFKLGSIHLPPNALVTPADIDKIVGPDAHVAAKGQTLRTTWFLITSRYKAAGYLDCVVTPHPEFDEATGTVNYTVAVDPGPVYHLAFVKFDGVSDELRSRLIRLWQMLPGDAFDESYVANFIMRAEKEDPVLMRSLAGVKVTYDVLADQQTREVNCVIHFARAQQTP
jgi:outer membrane protein insertion porin family